MTRAVLAAATLGFFSCARQSRLAHFPVGLFGVDNPTDLSAVRNAGFDTVQSYNAGPSFLRDLAAAANREGLRLLISPQRLMASSVSARGFPIEAWYLVDEPDVQRMPPQAVEGLDRAVKAWSRGEPNAFVVGDGRAAARYAASGDALMVDWYPVPHLPLESLGDHVALTVQAAQPKPVWAVIQSMDWREYPRSDPQKPPVGRFPTREEMRFMSYDAVLNGAHGLWYFAFVRPNGKTLLATPDRWAALTSVSQEMAAMRLIFQEGRMIPLPFPPDPDGLASRAWRYRGRDYVVIANRRRGYELKCPGALLDERWRPLFAARRDARELLDHVGAAWYVMPYQVLVFESRLSLGGSH